MNKTILITGAGGFVGLALFNSLKQYNPVGITFNAKKLLPNLVNLDLREPTFVKRLFNDIKPDTVFHFVALTNPLINENNKKLAYESNVIITKNIVANISKNVNLIYHSTDKVFDGKELKPSGDSEPNPNNYHGELKAECESIIKKQCEKFHILRLSVIHSHVNLSLLSEQRGPGSFIDKAINDIKCGKNINAFENIFRCFTKREELITFHRLLINSNHYGTYNVGSEMTSYYERIKTLCLEQDIDYKDNLNPVKGNVIPLKQNMDTSKIYKLFNYKFT